MDLHAFLIRHAIGPLWARWERSPYLRHYRQLRETQFHDPDAIRNRQRERLKALAQERRRFGYRRLHVLLRREGHAVNRKRVQRLYREERLTVRRRGGRKRAMGTRRPMVTPLAPDQRWSLDFLSDAFSDGRRFRILAIVDDFTRECLALIPDTSLPGRRVARELDVHIASRGRPAVMPQPPPR